MTAPGRYASIIWRFYGGRLAARKKPGYTIAGSGWQKRLATGCCTGK